MVAALVAVAAFPTSEGGEGAEHGGGEPGGTEPPAGGLDVTDLAYFVWERHEPAGSHLYTWVNVTNPREEPAVNLTGEMRGAKVAFVGGGVTTGATGSVGRGASASHQFAVKQRTTETISVQVVDRVPLASIGLEVTSPSGRVFPGAASGQRASVSLSTADVDADLFGEWTATVSHTGGLRGFSYSVTYTSEFQDTAENVSLPELPAGATYEVYFNIWADEPYTTIPPDLSITVNATVPGEHGGERVSYVARFQEPVVEVPVDPPRQGGGSLMAGEFLGFVAIGVIGLSVASGALRVRGGRARSRDRARTEVSLHRVAWLAVIGVLSVHGLVQLTSGHAPVGAVVLGTAAFAGLAAIVWFNAFQRKRVLAMEWRMWLVLKLGAVLAVLAFVGLHLALYGRHF